MALGKRQSLLRALAPFRGGECACYSLKPDTSSQIEGGAENAALSRCALLKLGSPAVPHRATTRSGLVCGSGGPCRARRALHNQVAKEYEPKGSLRPGNTRRL
ncbi:hypothetical protein BU26DRAFT_510237 [Trematosphaeria pertusa]|uniref:Uncharacterized protein n=1 Tax=Trematosphaeria pertusa TaxID=390896 RepID=A0A6A6HXU0_9PLEO|nr:uncharacterized protein BU26DRAFT_510237 [Trematosphaeria pertusa]KAF2243034.1 hypothetical protein BU26DRAFT_510237 [Trematosphaeria pertusa]